MPSKPARSGAETGTKGAPGRRVFLKLALKGSFGAALAAAVFRGPLRELWAGVRLPFPDHEPLAGACHAPLSEEELTVAAIVDTVVPGSDVDPRGAPGAREACALNLIYDEFYPFVVALPAMLLLVNTLAQNTYSKKFLQCSLEQRTKVLTQSENTMPLIRLAYRFIRSAFYATTYNIVGAKYLNWPGPNLGYKTHAEMSFNKPVSKELTKDGNLP